MSSDAEAIHVVVGVITDPTNRVLIARRPLRLHQGGLWEFPGGKVDEGEERIAALARELREELGLNVDRARPLIRFGYQYPDRFVDLDVWRVTAWHGKAQGLEGQEVRWVSLEELNKFESPKPNRLIVRSLTLPALYLITPDIRTWELSKFLRRLESCLAAGVQMVQLRLKSASEYELSQAADKIFPVCRSYGAKVLVNASPEQAMRLQADGVHLNSTRLSACRGRPLPETRLVAASCHDRIELLQAESIDADFAVLGPVRDSPSHPGVAGIGWGEFEHLCAQVKLPVYALGGLAARDQETAYYRGAQGLAMISGIWNVRDPARAVRTCTNTLS